MAKTSKFHLKFHSIHEDLFFIAHWRRSSSRAVALRICKRSCNSLPGNNCSSTFKLEHLRSVDSLILSMAFVRF
jgi:hypothetical protein